MMEKAIKISRAFLEWEWLASPEAVSLYLFLLLRASTRKNAVNGYDIERGQVLILRATLIRLLGITSQKLTTSLRRLSEGGYINIVKVRRYYLITLNKYDDFATIDVKQGQ